RVTEIYRRRAEEIFDSIVAETARWQLQRTWTRDLQWLRELSRLENDFFPRRTEIVLAQLRAARLVARVAAPDVSLLTTRIDPGQEIFLSAREGEIWYTLDGTDPRLPGGGISPTAMRVSESESNEHVALATGAAVRVLVPPDGSVDGQW